MIQFLEEGKYIFLSRMNGTESLLKHVKNIKHWRKVGKIFLNNHLLQTFNPTQDPVLPQKKEVGI